MPLKHYRELVVWQRAMDLAEAVYAATRSFPREEMLGLTNQVRRAAVSIASNIAEGQGRSGSKEFLHFLWIANGSLQEVETQLQLAARLGYLDQNSLDYLLTLTSEVGRLNFGLMRSLRGRGRASSTGH